MGINNTFFTGLADLYKPQDPKRRSGEQPLRVFPGHVVDICLDPDSALYESTRDIGKILFRDLITELNTVESTLNKVAYPLDRSISRYPLPGEEVLIYVAIGETDSRILQSMSSIYFYSIVVSTHNNVTYNSDPLIGTSVARIHPYNPLYTEEQAVQRFDNKLKSIESYKTGKDAIIYKQLRPFEGDFILQGRFGNTIRFGSTSPKENNPWSKAGIAGSSIMVLRVDRDQTIKESDMLTTEDIDADDASIYMCTSQNVELSLGCSKELKSWKARYALDSSGGAGTSTLAKGEDTSVLWQKVIDTTIPSSDAYKTPVDGTDDSQIG